MYVPCYTIKYSIFKVHLIPFDHYACMNKITNGPTLAQPISKQNKQTDIFL